MISRTIHIPLKYNKSFFLLGPRGTGKTFWVKASMPNALYINLLDSEKYLALASLPKRIEEFIPPNFTDWIIIDEIQKIPLLLNEVHRLIEEKKHKFVLTGSSARSLRKKGVNLLAGRAIVYYLYPLTVQELGEHFDLRRSLHYGNLPAILSEPKPEAYLKAYINTYLKEEVQQEGLTRNLGSFIRFLEVASFSQGSILNMAQIARDVGVHQKIVASYFEILDDLLLAYRLPIFSKRAKRKVINHPKFYFFDAGIYSALKPKGIIDSEAELEGVALETLFLQELHAINEYYQLDYQIFYWRTQTGLEVDFVLYGSNGFYAFEIKRSNYVSKRDAKGLQHFSEEYPEAKLYLLYGGNQKYYYDNVIAQSITETLKNLFKILKPPRVGT
jgi:uncharacterized protein